MATIRDLKFDNRNLRDLPVDPNTQNYCRTVPNSFFSFVTPTPIKDPEVVAISPSALALLGIEDTSNEADLAAVLSGNELLRGSQPAAHCYCGFQFGNFAGQLGDGAAISLGEVINGKKDGERWELQLKGAGLTPYSRNADGRKVLRSSIREFLGQEHLHRLGIPSTRGGAVVVSHTTTVARDPFYDGQVRQEPCAVVSRIAPHFFRFGSLEIFLGGARPGPAAGARDLLPRFLQHLIDSYYPDLLVPIEEDDSAAPAASWLTSFDHRVIALYHRVVSDTASLFLAWQGTGFVHGVLNTDNLSLAGITIDYGPFGFLEAYDEDYTPNGSDHSGRYSYGRQLAVGRFNLRQLGQALLAYWDYNQAGREEEKERIIARALASYDEAVESGWRQLQRRKLGLPGVEGRDGDRGEAIEKEEKQLLDEFWVTMRATSCDFTNCFLALTEYREAMLVASSSTAPRERLIEQLTSVSASVQALLGQAKRKLRIHRLSMPPQQVLQLHGLLTEGGARGREMLLEMFGGEVTLEEVRTEIEAEYRKLQLLQAAVTTIRRYEGPGGGGQGGGGKAAAVGKVQVAIDLAEEQRRRQQEQRGLWTAWVTRYESYLEQQQPRRLTKDQQEAQQVAACRGMREVNPTFVLRNWMLQEAIEQAEGPQRNYAATRCLLELASRPYDPALSPFKLQGQGKGQGMDGLTEEQRRFLKPAPQWADELLCTCSS